MGIFNEGTCSRSYVPECLRGNYSQKAMQNARPFLEFRRSANWKIRELGADGRAEVLAAIRKAVVKIRREKPDALPYFMNVQLCRTIDALYRRKKVRKVSALGIEMAKNAIDGKRVLPQEALSGEWWCSHATPCQFTPVGFVNAAKQGILVEAEYMGRKYYLKGFGSDIERDDRNSRTGKKLAYDGKGVYSVILKEGRITELKPTYYNEPLPDVDAAVPWIGNGKKR